jgi:drug/metabolite transporter (DMT)-like permease
VTIYTTLDKSIVASVDPLVYNFWVYAGISAGYAVRVWWGPRRPATISEIRQNWRPVIVGSVATVASYLLALVAMTMTTASYVGAVRATSVLIGAFLGHLVLGEGFGRWRVLAAGVIAAGLIAMALAT